MPGIELIKRRNVAWHKQLIKALRGLHCVPCRRQSFRPPFMSTTKTAPQPRLQAKEPPARAQITKAAGCKRHGLAKFSLVTFIAAIASAIAYSTVEVNRRLRRISTSQIHRRVRHRRIVPGRSSTLSGRDASNRGGAGRARSTYLGRLSASRDSVQART